MKKLLAFLTLFAIAYPTAADAREMVLVGSGDGRKIYVWRDSIRRVNQFVWWTSEGVRHDDGKVTIHNLDNFSGDCREGIRRRLKNTDLLRGTVSEIVKNRLKVTHNGVNVRESELRKDQISAFKKHFEPTLVIPGSVRENELN